MARSLGHDLLLHLFSRQRTQDKPYEGRAVETSSVYGCSSIMAAVDTTIQEDGLFSGREKTLWPTLSSSGDAEASGQVLPLTRRVGIRTPLRPQGAVPHLPSRAGQWREDSYLRLAGRLAGSRVGRRALPLPPPLRTARACFQACSLKPNSRPLRDAVSLRQDQDERGGACGNWGVQARGLLHYRCHHRPAR
jgi:hypothetical protein